MFWTELSLAIFQFKSFGDLDFWLSWRISLTLKTRSMGITENFQVSVFTIFTINISSLGIFPRLPMGCRKPWLFKYTGITIILKHSESSKRIFPSWKRGQWVAGINKPWVEWQQTLRQNKLNSNFQKRPMQHRYYTVACTIQLAHPILSFRDDKKCDMLHRQILITQWPALCFNLKRIIVLFKN